MAEGDGTVGSADQVAVLRALWEEMKALGRKSDRTSEQLEAARDELARRAEAVRVELLERFDGLRAEIRRNLAETEVRVATELVSVAEALRGVTDLLRERALERAEITKLRERLDRLEERLP